MGLIGNLLDRGLENLKELNDQLNPEPKHFADRDPRSLGTEGEIYKMRRLQEADDITKMQNLIDFATDQGNINMMRALENRLANEVYEYSDILEKYGYSENDIDF